VTAKVFHAHLQGTREAKYERLAEGDMSQTKWTELSPSSPFYLFVPQDAELRTEYEEAWKITEVMPVNGVGMTTARDHVVIDFDAVPLIERATFFRDSSHSDAEVCRLLEIPLKKGWNIPNARRLIRQETDLHRHIKPIQYRPFDERLIFYHDSLVWRTVKRVMRHMLVGANRSLCTTRSTEIGAFEYIYSAPNIS